MVWNALTDEDRKAAFDALPGGLEGFLKQWGWLHFAKAIEELCRTRNTALGACPFCGFDTPILLDNMGGATHYVHCPQCGATGPERTSAADAAEGWASRTPPARGGSR